MRDENQVVNTTSTQLVTSVASLAPSSSSLTSQCILCHEVESIKEKKKTFNK